MVSSHLISAWSTSRNADMLPLAREKHAGDFEKHWQTSHRFFKDDSKRSFLKMIVYLFLATSIYCLFLLPSMRESAASYIPKVSQQYKQKVDGSILTSPLLPNQHQQKKYAYATFLSSTYSRNESRPWISDQEYNEDQFFVHARLLTFQLKHLPLTRSQAGYPLLVLCSPSVESWKKEKLRADGAEILEVDTIPFEDWMGAPAEPRWSEVFTKLLVFQLEEYDRILFIDLDMVLTSGLDEVFEASEAVVLPTDLSNTVTDEGALPQEYLVVGGVDVGKGHRWPDATIGFSKFFNAGFFLIKPSKTLFDHYMSIFKIPQRFDPHYPEQGLMNYAHREDGPMPCQYFEPGKFYANWPNKGDLQHGVNALHFKYTTRATHDKEIIEVTNQRLGEMYGFYLARGQFAKGSM